MCRLVKISGPKSCFPITFNVSCRFTLSHLTSRREFPLNLGIGAGWYEHEWRAYGYGFPEGKAENRPVDSASNPTPD